MANLINIEKPTSVMVETPLIIEQKRFLDDLLKSSQEKKDYTEHPAAYLEGESKELHDRVLYLCLRGLREGILEFMEEARIMQPTDIFDKNFPLFSNHKNIENYILKYLLKDQLVRRYLAWDNSQDIFEANCENIAIKVVSHYINQIRANLN